MKAILLALLALLALTASAHHERIRDLRRQLKRQTPEQNAKHTWAVLVAGSTSWSNYRHQADVCHAYQLLHKAGVPDERIIVFMYDDIARSSSNPYPGKVYNKVLTKTSEDVDVYEGVPTDYTGKNATTKNLIAVLSGEVPLSGSGKTLQSTEEDNVFFYYDDHGNVGLIAMPYGGNFYESDMTTVLETMSSKKMFDKFIIFVQACDSGSMFYRQNIPENVYISTSAPIETSAYACFYDPTLRTYIASCWPYGWMNEIEAAGIDTTFDNILSVGYYFAVNKSGTRPCQYGDVDLRRQTLREFFAPEESDDVRMPVGNGAHKHAHHKHHHKHHARHHRSIEFASTIEYDDTACPQFDVPYQIAKRNYEHSDSNEDYIEYQRQIDIRKKINNVFYRIIDAALPANDATTSYFKTPVCTKCSDECECVADCKAAGYTDSECTLHCCDDSGCLSTNAGNSALECSVELSAKFEASCGHINNDYIYAAGKILGRLCKYPKANIQAAIDAIPAACAAY